MIRELFPSLYSNEAMLFVFFLSYFLYKYAEFGLDKWDKRIIKSSAAFLFIGFIMFRLSPDDAIISYLGISLFIIPWIYYVPIFRGRHCYKRTFK